MIAAPFAVAAPGLAELLGPAHGPFVASAEMLAAWVDRAAIGARCIYARGVRLPRMAGGAERARFLSDRGLLQLNTAPTGAASADGLRMFDYLATRRTPPDAGAAATLARIEQLGRDARAIYDLIYDLADRGDPLPTRDAMAQMTDMRPADVTAATQRLEASGLIRFANIKGSPWRSAMIVETGARTGVA